MSSSEFFKPKKPRRKKADRIDEVFDERGNEKTEQIIEPQIEVYEEQSFWSHSTPLEAPDGYTVNSRVIEINGMFFQARSDCEYKFHPYKIFDEIERLRNLSPEERKANPSDNVLSLFRTLILNDLWFFVYFVMRNPLANHPFIIKACAEIENEKGDTLQVWARDHLKTTIISVGRTCQEVLQNPEERIAIFSATRPLAIKIQNAIKNLFETPLLIACFPDILYEDPYKDAEKWSESPEGGLIVKRKGFYREATISSWGLIEGQPIGQHFTKMKFDDIVTVDLQTPDIIAKVIENFEMSENLGTRDRQITVIGTFYRHDDPLVYIMNKKDPATNEKMFKTVKKAATVDGTPNGKAAFIPEKALARKRAGILYIFFCQQLLDPTPRGAERLNRNMIILVRKNELPESLYKFMMIDGSGDEGKRKDGRPPDDWAMGVFGVNPFLDDLGLSDVYVLDLLIRQMPLDEAQKQAVEMYCRNGRILKLGIEKVGISTTEIHIAAALRAKKRFVDVKYGNLHILSPEKRSKQTRIESAIAQPLKHGKIHMLDTVPLEARERLGQEMEKFPVWRDDGLDILSYLYDILKDYRFGLNFGEGSEQRKKADGYDDAFRKAREELNSNSTIGWMKH